MFKSHIKHKSQPLFDEDQQQTMRVYMMVEV